jgi:hypothetical protein
MENTGEALVFAELYYLSCNYLREAKKHDISGDFDHFNNDTFNDSDMYHHHHHHHRCGVMK